MVLQDVPLPTERKFGGFFTGVFLLAAGYFQWRGAASLALVLLALAIGFGVTTVVAPVKLRPLNILWFRLGLLLARVMNPLVLGAIFFILLTPIALAARIRGRDVLRMKPRQVPSYWVDREQPLQRDSFKQQF